MAIITSSVMLSCANSCPPLNPIENKRYKEINFAELDGISKSLFSRTAMMPNRKNRNAGLLRLLISRVLFIN